MTKSFSLPKKNDVFLVVLLMGSLSLNVYLGWKVKQSRRSFPEPQNSVKLLPGATVQPVTATSLSGKIETFNYADSGKPTVFYVFSPSCIWCERNNQNINAIARLKGESFRFVGLSLGNDGLPNYAESHQVGFPIYKSLKPESVEMLGLGPTPQTIVISPDGHVLKNWVGAFSGAIQPQVEEFFNVRLPGLVAAKR